MTPSNLTAENEYRPARTMPSDPDDYQWYWLQSWKRGVWGDGQRDGLSLLFSEIPRSLRRRCVECKSPIDRPDMTVCDYCDRSMDGWTNDDRYNDPRRGQAKWINGQR